MGMLEENIVPFVQTYIQRFNELCEEFASLGDPARLYCEPIYTALIEMASDGIAVFYFSEKMAKAGGLSQGVGADERQSMTLAYMLQALTANMLKVTSPSSTTRVKADLSNVSDCIMIPPDLPVEEAQGGINPEALKWYVDNNAGRNLIGMSLSPIWSYEEGLPKEAQPTRKHVFSPAVATAPDHRLVLQFIFQFADVLWQADKLALSAEAGQRLAELDLEVLRFGLQVGIPAKALSEDPFDSVARHIDSVCDGFTKLLNDKQTEEAQVQTFLDDKAHSFLITPVSKDIVAHKRLRGSPSNMIIRSE